MSGRLAWRVLHNCVAHPLMALAELAGHGVGAFHDWTAAKAFPEATTPTEARK